MLKNLFVFAVILFFNLLNHASLSLDEMAKKENAEDIYKHLKLRRVYPHSFQQNIHPETPLGILTSYTPSKKFKLTDKQKYKLSYLIRSVTTLVAHLTTLDKKVFFQYEIRDLSKCLDLAATFCAAWNYPTKDRTFSDFFKYVSTSLKNSTDHAFKGEGIFYKDVKKHLRPFMLSSLSQINTVSIDLLEVTLFYRWLFIPNMKIPHKYFPLPTEVVAKALINRGRAEIVQKHIEALMLDLIYRELPISRELKDILETAQQQLNLAEDPEDDDCCGCIN